MVVPKIMNFIENLCFGYVLHGVACLCQSSISKGRFSLQMMAGRLALPHNMLVELTRLAASLEARNQLYESSPAGTLVDGSPRA